jgi:hypothetical protein
MSLEPTGHPLVLGSFHLILKIIFLDCYPLLFPNGENKFEQGNDGFNVLER